MDKVDKKYVLCVKASEEHTLDSILVKCVECSTNLWVSPHHIKMKHSPLCLDCLSIVSDKLKIKQEELEFKVLEKDMKRALDYIVFGKGKDGIRKG